jgi:hypothetical protein
MAVKPAAAAPAAAKKGSKTNPTREKGDAAAPALTNTVCEHCGERIAAGQVVAIRRTTFTPEGKSQTRMYRFAKGHPTEPAA